tara:strand:- start:39355 stop:40521 length:1167 start_codon:yes stop_codon:yes gene_type:complete
MASIDNCFACAITDEYVKLANQFTQDLSSVLLTPMWVIFLGISGLWIISHGLKFILGKPDIGGLAQEFVFLVIAAALLGGQGPDLINLIYKSALSTMSGAASVVLSAGGKFATHTGAVMLPSDTGPAGIANLEGMSGLVYVAQKGVLRVFQMAQNMLSEATLTNPSPIVMAIITIVPYALLLIVYFAQVVVTIFRVMMFAALSPILMMALGFGWGKDVALSGIRTLFAAFMVLFGTTIALAVCLYGVNSLGIAADPETAKDVSKIMKLDNPTLWVAIALGWLGTAFMAEATSMANSIAGSQLTNQAAAVITAGAVGTGLYFLNQTKGQWGDTAANAAGRGVGMAAQGAGGLVSAAIHPVNAAEAAAGKLSPAAQALMDKIRRTNGTAS